MCVFIGFLDGKTLRELRKAVTPFHASAHRGANRLHRHFRSQICRTRAADKRSCHLRRYDKHEEQRYEGNSGNGNNFFNI